VIRNVVSVGIYCQWCGSVTVVAEFPGSMIRDVWYLELPVDSKCSYSRVCDIWYDNCILLRCQSLLQITMRLNLSLILMRYLIK
jgi:hypothetical protein